MARNPQTDDQADDTEGVDIDADAPDEDAEDGPEGGAEGEDTGEDDDDAQDGDEGDESDLPPSVRAILKKNRDRVREVEKEIRRLKREGRAKAGADAQQRLDKLTGSVKRTAARAALQAAGLTGSPDRFIKMLDLDAIEVDDDGEVDGLEDQIEEFRVDYPELFPKRGPQRRRIGGGDGAPRTGGTTAKSSAATLAGQLTGGR